MESSAPSSKQTRNSQKFRRGGQNPAGIVNYGSGAIWENAMIRKLKSGQYRLYSRKKNPKTGKRRNLGTFANREAAEKHERAVQFFKRGGGGRA